MQIKVWFLNMCECCIGAVVLNETFYSRDIHFGAEFVAIKQGINALRGLDISLG